MRRLRAWEAVRSVKYVGGGERQRVDPGAKSLARPRSSCPLLEQSINGVAVCVQYCVLQRGVQQTTTTTSVTVKGNGTISFAGLATQDVTTETDRTSNSTIAGMRSPILPAMLCIPTLAAVVCGGVPRRAVPFGGGHCSI